MEERYGLTWPGRAAALDEASAPVDVRLGAPLGEGHAVVVGDNLDALRALRAELTGHVRLIYVDPPYNTGGDDFVYRDDFSEGVRAYRERGAASGSSDRLATNRDRAGRRHSGWLSMMLPRLLLARELLREDGAICVSIDAHEDFHLRLLLDEVFGPDNLVGQLVVIRAEGGGMAEQVVQGHDLLLVYARDRSQFVPLRRPKDFRGQVVQHEGAEYWIEEDWLRREFGRYGTLHYEDILEVRGQAYLDEVDARLASGDYRLLRKKHGRHVVGRLRPTATDGSKFYSVVKHLSRDGKRRLAALGLEGVFEFPKPVSLVQSLVLGATFGDPGGEDVVLDFFAGSGTTADAVLQQNALDGGNRRFVLVTPPEPVSARSVARARGYETIADVTLARVCAAMADVGVDPAGLVVSRVVPAGVSPLKR